MNQPGDNLFRIRTPSIRILNFDIPAFRFFGLIGFISACLLMSSIVAQNGLKIGVILFVIGTIVATFFAATYLFLTKNRVLVFYHYKILIYVNAALTLWLFGEPILAYLDIISLGIGIFLAIGRWGCLFVGCCHGRPCNCKLGVVYSKEYLELGFPHYYIGLKMFPLPLIESFFIFTLVSIGCYILLNLFPAGTTFIWYATSYGIIRYMLEFFRGDVDRPYWLGFSEAQWTSVLVVSFTVWLSYLNLLPYYKWHLWAGFGLFIFTILIGLVRSRQSFPKHLFFSPKHIKTIVDNLSQIDSKNFQTLNASAPPIPIIKTYLGLQLSYGETFTTSIKVSHYTVSKTTSSSLRITPRLIIDLAKLLVLIRHRDQPFEIFQRSHGIYHILFAVPPGS